MNDLFSNSFKRCTDLKQQACLDDTDSSKETVDLADFFHDVENVRDNIKQIEKLYEESRESYEESKTIQDAKTIKQFRTRMSSNVQQVLKRAKIIKQKIEALEHSNVRSRTVPGCGSCSSADRTRTAVVVGLVKKLKDLMDEFQKLRMKMTAEYKETVERRYFTVTGEKADEETIENLISSGESESFLQKAIEQQGGGQLLDIVSEIQERHDAVKEMERSLMELHQLFLDMAALVEAQGHQLDDIESHVACASSFVRRGTDQIQAAKEHQKSSKKWTCIGIVLAAVICILAIPIIKSTISQ